MKLHELSPAEGAKKERFRVGRGHGSGNGKTAGKGHKGQNARSGGGVRPGFEGGQMPLYRRIARRGFSNAPFKKEYAILNVADLEKKFADGETVNRESLKARRLVGKVKDGIKILGNGDISKKLVIEVEKISAAAKEKVEKAGGSVQLIPEKSVKSK